MKIMSKQEQRQTRLGLPSVSNLCKTKFLSVLAVTAILLSSCSSDDTMETPEVNNGMVKFSSGVNAATPKVGGAEGTIWSTYDVIGIYMLKAGQGLTDANIVEGKKNVSYRAESSATSTSFKPGSSVIYYPVDGSKVDFFSYYPYTASLDDYVFKVDLSDQDPQTDVDLMIAKANNSNLGYDKTNQQSVNLVFDHQLVKVVMNVTRGEGLGQTDLANVTAKIKGMNTKADFDMKNSPAVLSNMGTPSDNMAAFVVKGGGDQPAKRQIEAILLPVTFDDSHIVEFTAAGNTYTWKMKENTVQNSSPITRLEVGKIYTFDIKLTKYKAEVTGEIKPWEPAGNPATGIAD